MKIRRCMIIALILVMAWPAFGRITGVGDVSPPFVLKTIDGSMVRSNDIKGKKPMFLVFWATWCSICREEIPNLKKIYSTFEPKGMGFVAINIGVNDSLTRVKRFIAKYKIAYPVAFDEGSRVTKRFNIHGTPTIIIVDKRGIVRYRSASIPDDFEKYFQGLIKQ